MRHSTINKDADLALRELYRDSFPMCEVAFYTGLTVKDCKIHPMWTGLVIDATDLCHIMNGGIGKREDVWPNLVHADHWFHRWSHQFIHEGRVAFVATKLRKRERLGRPEEFDEAELFAATGKHIAGVIEGYEFSDPRFSDLQAECLSRLAALVSEQEQ